MKRSRFTETQIKDDVCSVPMPVKQLKGFQRIYLNPGESGTVESILADEELSFYDINLRNYSVEPATFTVMVGSSSRDIRLTGSFDIDASFTPTATPQPDTVPPAKPAGLRIIQQP